MHDRIEGHPEIEIVPFSFKEMVLEGQNKWRSLINKPIKEISQEADLPPHISDNIMNLVIDNLPAYIPENIKENIRQSHPKPIIAVGVLADKRDINTHPPYSAWINMPEDIKDKQDQQDCYQGLRILNEITVELLTGQVISNLGSKHKWFKPAASLFEKINSKNGTYLHQVRNIDQFLNGRGEFGSFTQNLIIAMISGDTHLINQQLKTVGFEDLHHFALEIARNTNVTFQPGFMDKIKDPRLLKSLENGSISANFPGVIHIKLLPYLLSYANTLVMAYNIATFSPSDHPLVTAIKMLGFGLQSSMALYPFPVIAHTLVHENIHYLSENENHDGLIPRKIIYLT